MTTAIRYTHREASERLTLNNPAQARKGAVWGCPTCVPDGVPEARALNVRDNRESASLRDAYYSSYSNPTLRFKRGCSPRSRPHACAGLLRVSASGTFQEHDTTDGVERHRRETTEGSPNDRNCLTEGNGQRGKTCEHH